MPQYSKTPPLEVVSVYGLQNYNVLSNVDESKGPKSISPCIPKSAMTMSFDRASQRELSLPDTKSKVSKRGLKVPT